MNLLIVSSILLAISLVSQITIWRVRIPKNQSFTILTIFFISFVIFFIPIYELFGKIILKEKFYAEFIQAFLFHFCFLFCYLITFTAIEKDSPSIILMIKIFRCGKKGLELSRIFKIITNYKFIKMRIDDLLISKFILYNNKKYSITTKGKNSIKIVSFFQMLINQKNKSS